MVKFGEDLVCELRLGVFNGIIHKQEMLFSGNITYRTPLNMIFLKFALATGLIMQLVGMVQMMRWDTLMIFWIFHIHGMKMVSA